MAIWIVNTNAETGSVVGNEGPLKSVIDAATSGDTIIFDTTQFPQNTETTIDFSSTKEIQKSLTIDATHDANGNEISGATWLDNGVLKTRVVINLQGGAYRAFGIRQNNNYNCTIAGITFYNGSNTNGGAIYLRYSELTINKCVFKSFNSANGGGFYNNGSIATLNTCFFDACNVSASGGAAYITGGKTHFYNCSFNNCVATSQGGGINIAGTTSSVTVNNCRFTNCVATNGGSIYCNGTVNIANTDFISQASDTNVLLNITTTTFSDVTANAVYTNAGASVIISGALTVNVLTTKTGTTVIFSGVDSILAVTTTFSASNATFQATPDSTGYLALYDGATVPTVGTGVKTCIYGAGVSYVHAQTDGVEYVASNPSTPVLIEKKTGSTWTTLTDSAIDGAYATTLDAGDIIRVFDGVHFVSDDVPVFVDYWRVYNYAANTNGGGTDSDGNRIEAWSVDSYALPQNGGGYDPETGESLPGWTVANYALTPNLEGAGNENQ